MHLCLSIQVFPCPVAVLAGESAGMNGWLLANGCSVADGSVVSDRRWYITVIPDAELAPGSYCLTAYAGICAKNGKITENDFKVHFTVEGEEAPPDDLAPELSPEPDPELAPDPLPGSESDQILQDPNPDPDLVPTENPSRPPPSENMDEGKTEPEQNPSLFPGTDGGNGGGFGQAMENGSNAGLGAGTVTGNQEFSAADNQPDKPSEPDAGLSQMPEAPAVRKPEPSMEKTQKTDNALEKEPEEGDRFFEDEPDFQNGTAGPSEHFTVTKIKLGGTGEKLQMARQPGTYRSNLDGNASFRSTAGEAGGTLLAILIPLLGIGAVTRTVSFWKDIA